MLDFNFFYSALYACPTDVPCYMYSVTRPSVQLQAGTVLCSLWHTLLMSADMNFAQQNGL